MEKVKLVCNECGKKFKVSPKAADPECPKCGGVDWEVREPDLAGQLVRQAREADASDERVYRNK